MLVFGILCYLFFVTLIFQLILRFLRFIHELFSLQLVTVSQRVLQTMGHACRKLHPQSSLGSASVRAMYLDGSVISAFQVTGDTEGIHLGNAEVSFPF